MNYYLAPSFRDKKVLCEPYEKDGKLYVKIQGKTKPREVRAYTTPLASWQKNKETAIYVEWFEDYVVPHNYTNEHYSEVIGIRTDKEGRRGVWFYRRLPNAFEYKRGDNIMLSPVLGYHGSIEEEPIEKFDPIFVSEDEIIFEKGFKRLVTATWWEEEVARIHRIYTEEE